MIIKKMTRGVIRLLLVFWLLLTGPVIVLIFGPLELPRDSNLSSRSSAQLAPAANTPQNIIQVYAARLGHWRGAFAIHTWIATKRSQANIYNIYQVIGSRQLSGHSTLVIEEGIPDRYWFGQKPQLLLNLQGDSEVESLIDKLETIVPTYPYRNNYREWPGPNSNTFTAFIAHQIPELHLKLPATAIGKDFLPNGQFWQTFPNHIGIQFSLHGVLGLTLSLKRGIEINLLTLAVGLDPWNLALNLPGIGQITAYSSY